MSIQFAGKVAIVTGGGQGLGRAHALALAARGARVVVNDIGGALDGSGGSKDPAEAVAAEIEQRGGEAIASTASIVRYDEVENMVREATQRWGRVDIVVNNAGILRDKSFGKLELADIRAVLDVHYFGAVHCIKACWEQMREQQFGRIVVTTSCAGMFGNFGQAAYSSAKLAVIGLMNTLAVEGAKYNIRVNALTPCAATRMTEKLLSPLRRELLTPDSAAAVVCFLASENAPTRTIVNTGAGSFSVSRLVETQGKWLPPAQQTPDGILEHWTAIREPAGQLELHSCDEQTGKFLAQATAGLGIKLDN